jgi:hypothetical protein
MAPALLRACAPDVSAAMSTTKAGITTTNLLIIESSGVLGLHSTAPKRLDSVRSSCKGFLKLARRFLDKCGEK